LIDYTRTGVCCWGLSDCEEWSGPQVNDSFSHEL